jgi:hypothetical protein
MRELKKLSLFCLACQHDRKDLINCGLIEDGPDSDQEFSIERFTSNNQVLTQHGINITRNFTCYCCRGDENTAIDRLQEAIENQIGAFIVFEGYNTDCQQCNRLLNQIKTHAKEHGISIIVLRCGEQILSESLDDERKNNQGIEFQYLPFREKAPFSGQNCSPERFKDLRSNFAQALRVAIESLQSFPHVGIGGLLLNQEGKFLLTARKRHPGAGKIGTFGGILPKHAKIQKKLQEYAKQELDLEIDHIKIGPLLSCTNMIINAQHYIDLTYLVTLKNDRASPKIANSASHGYAVDNSEKLALPYLW